MIILELATGTYPYKNATFVELLQLVVNEPSPEVPNDENYTEDFRNFIKKWYFFYKSFGVILIIFFLLFKV